MDTPRDRLNSLYDDFFQEAKDIFLRKSKDYNRDDDPLSGFRDWGAMGIMVRLGDKFGRIRNIYQRGGMRMVLDETVRDTLLDICNYCFLLHAVIHDEETGFLRTPAAETTYKSVPVAEASYAWGSITAPQEQAENPDPEYTYAWGDPSLPVARKRVPSYAVIRDGMKQKEVARLQRGLTPSEESILENNARKETKRQRQALLGPGEE